MVEIKLTTPRIELTAELNDSPTSRLLLDILPWRSTANTWGDEVYFDAPVATELQADAQQVVEPGTLCYWVEGNSIAMPFGPTPISEGDECRLVTRVNIIGKILADPKLLAEIRQGDEIRIELA